MHHVLITYFTLKIIYFAGIACICNVDAEALDGHWGGGGRGGGGGKLCPFQMSILTNTFVACHNKFWR